MVGKVTRKKRSVSWYVAVTMVSDTVFVSCCRVCGRRIYKREFHGLVGSIKNKKTFLIHFYTRFVDEMARVLVYGTKQSTRIKRERLAFTLYLTTGRRLLLIIIWPAKIKLHGLPSVRPTIGRVFFGAPRRGFWSFVTRVIFYTLVFSEQRVWSMRYSGWTVPGDQQNDP